MKDGCSPQGQCGCCTVWVDGAPASPVSRRSAASPDARSPPSRERRRSCAIAGRPPSSNTGRASAASARRASSSVWPRSKVPHRGGHRRARLESALRAHLCRCTGWQSIVDAACSALGVDSAARLPRPSPQSGVGRLARPGRRAGLSELRPRRRPRRGGFADDSAPSDALVQLGADGRSPPASAPPGPGPVACRAGQHGAAVAPGRAAGRGLGSYLQTSWLEPAYVEPDAVGPPRPASRLSPGDGGAFGGKRHSPVPTGARELADATGAVVRVLWRREDVVRRGPAPAPGGRAACRRVRARPRRAHDRFGRP